jgi:arsenate reductase
LRCRDGERPVSVLFVCHDNATLGLVAESIVRSLHCRRLSAASAGIRPAGSPNPLAMEFLQQRGMPVEGLRPKPLHEACAGRHFDFLLALCPQAAAALPAGDRQVTATWNLEDLIEQMQDPRLASHAVRDAFWMLMRRIKIFASLPHQSAPRQSIRQRLEGLSAWC